MDSMQFEYGGEVLFRPWFALRVLSNRERVVHLHLRARGFDDYTPCYKQDRQWFDRVKSTEIPLFPGYVFCRLNPHDRLPVLSVPGVVGLVGFGRIPSPIPEHEMERVRRLVDSGFLVTPCPFLQVGDLVLIERGPLAGLEGILLRAKGQFRIVVSITLLQRSISAEIDRAWVRPLRKSDVRQGLIPDFRDVSKQAG